MSSPTPFELAREWLNEIKTEEWNDKNKDDKIKDLNKE